MITKNQIKLYKSLQQKKYRNLYNLFIAEGEKIVCELAWSKFNYEAIIIDKSRTKEVSTTLKDEVNYIEVETNTFHKISGVKTPPPVLGVFKKPGSHFDIKVQQGQLNIILDNIQDPGNLGTIIRIADWFAIKNIICSVNSVDVFNPKVIQATMGSIARVNVYYTDLDTLLENTTMNVYGTFIDGENVYNTHLEKEGYIVLGNEGQGISTAIQKHVSKRLHIPMFRDQKGSVDSLNISVAAGIICSEFKRRVYSK